MRQSACEEATRVRDSSAVKSPDIPDTPAGRQLRWWLASIDDPETMTAADVLGRYTRTWPGSPWLKGDAEGRQAWTSNWQEFGEFTIEGVDSVSMHEISIVLAPVSGSRRKITFLVEDDAPHRIRFEKWEQVFDFDLQVREATKDDAAALADIERRSLVVLGDIKIATNRGDDYFAAARLIEDVAVFIAEIEGRPAGVAWGALAPARFGGADIRVTYFFHLRVVPEHQRKGLWGALDNAVSSKYWESNDLYVGYYMIENVAWSHVAKQVQSRPDYVARDWIPTVYRVLLPTSSLARATAAGRPASRADATQIAAILNEFHEGEEFYLPYSEETLVSRLARDPTYSWDQVLMGDGAVLGVWPAGEKIEIVTERDGEVSRSRRGHVMDYGFRPGAEEEFSHLLAAWRSDLDSREIDQLSIFTSKGSRGQSVLKQFKGTVEAYRFNTGTSAMIPDAAQHTGIYTDHIFF